MDVEKWQEIEYSGPPPQRRVGAPPGCARYQCIQSKGGNGGVVANHRTQIRMPLIEKAVRERIAAVLLQHALVWAIVEGIRPAQGPATDTTSIEAVIASIDQSLQNLSELAGYASTEDATAERARRMNNLEAQKRQAESLLYRIAEDDGGRMAFEVELNSFEAWAERVRPFLTDTGYLEAATYNDLRLAVKILGIRVTVYPTGGDWNRR